MLDRSYSGVVLAALASLIQHVGFMPLFNGGEPLQGALVLTHSCDRLPAFDPIIQCVVFMLLLDGGVSLHERARADSHVRF